MKISESQLKLVNEQVQRLVASGNYFGRRLREAGVTEVRTESDFLALPFSEKEDLRNCYPLGGLRGGRAPDRAHPLQLGHHGHARDHPLHRQGHRRLGRAVPPLLRARRHHGRGPHPDNARLRPLDRGHRVSGGGREARRDGRPHGPRQHREAAAVHGRSADHGHRRHVELCLAARGGGREARHARPDCPHQGRHRLRALGPRHARAREGGPRHLHLRHLRPHGGLRPRHRHLLRRRERHALLGRLPLHRDR